MTKRNLVLVLGLVVNALTSVPAIVSEQNFAAADHYKAPLTEVKVKECKEANLKVQVPLEDIETFCEKLESSSTTFLRDFIHAVLVGDNTKAEALISLHSDELFNILAEYVQSQ